MKFSLYLCSPVCAMRNITLAIILICTTCYSLADEIRKDVKLSDLYQSDVEKEVSPLTLEEAHRQLESQLSKDELAKIDAMKSEDEMIQYHFGLGVGMRNGWGLWGGSLLAQHMRKLGFNHPDDMSAVILDTFWCKRHGKDFRLQERADYYSVYWKGVVDPPKTIIDPDDKSSIEWSFSFSAGNTRVPRQIHVGKSQKTGRWLAYEYDKGVYVPDTELQKRITELDRHN